MLTCPAPKACPHSVSSALPMPSCQKKKYFVFLLINDIYSSSRVVGVESTNQEAEGEIGNDIERNGDGGELQIPNMADEDTGERVHPVITQNIERDGPRNPP